MKAGLIARRELSALFRTAVGWAFVGSVALVNGLHFLAFAVNERRTSERVLEIYFHHAGYVMEGAGVLAALAVVGTGGPVEMLWRTAPVRSSEVVLGRFLAAGALVLLGSLASLQLPLLVLWVGHASGGHVLAGLLGQLALGLLGVALALLTTSMARRAVSGALGAGCAFAALELAPMLAAEVPPGVAKVLPLSAPVWSHNDAFRRGVLDLADVTFLAALVYAGLVAASLALEFRRWGVSKGARHPAGTRHRTLLALGTAVAAAVFGLSLFDATRHVNVRADLSLGRLDPPEAATREAVRQLRSDVTAFLFLDRRSPVYARLGPWLDQLAAESDHLQVQLVDRAAQPELARRYRVEREGTLVLAPMGTEGAEGSRLAIGTTLSSARPVLRRIDGEVLATLAAALAPPRQALFVQGHGERSLRDSGHLVALLRRSRFQPRTWDLTHSLDTGVESVVFLLAPESPLEPAEEEALVRFVGGGGRLLVALEPGGSHPQRLLATLGVRATEGMLRDATGEPRIRARVSSAHPMGAEVGDAEAPLHVEGAVAFTRRSRKAVAPLRVERAFVDADGDGARGAGERLGNHAVGITTRFQRHGPDGREGRGVLLGDGDLLADEALERPGPEALLRGALAWLSERDGERIAPVIATTPESIEVDHMGGAHASRSWALVIGLPALLLLVALWRRRET